MWTHITLSEFLTQEEILEEGEKRQVYNLFQDIWKRIIILVNGGRVQKQTDMTVGEFQK